MIKVVLDTNVFISALFWKGACALEAKASFIISGDEHLLEIEEYKGIKIISPKDFLFQI